MVKRGETINSKVLEKLKREIKEEILDELRFEKKVISPRNYPNEPSLKRNYVKLLIWLIVIVLVMDVFVFIFYFDHSFFSIFGSAFSSSGFFVKNFTGNSNNHCSDGTLYGKCSTNKPYLCYEGELVESAYSCGCPNGYVRDFQRCIKE